MGGLEKRLYRDDKICKIVIRFLQHREIDKVKWDQRLETALTSRIYAYSWYLDVVSPNWCALIEDDYESIFPIPIQKRIGIFYISQPLFTQQLGLFSSKDSNSVDALAITIPA